jgi:hypothetical protein
MQDKALAELLGGWTMLEQTRAAPDLMESRLLTLALSAR